MARRTWAVLAGFSMVAVVTAGCGSDDESTTTVASTEASAAVTPTDQSSATTVDAGKVTDTTVSSTVATTDTTDTTGTIGPSGTAGGTDAPATTTDASFPVTIEHKYGETVIEEQPLRVVSVGYTEQDAILALGVTPLTVLYWYGDEPFGVWPWAQDELGDAEPTMITGVDSDYETIAALDPDVILGVSSGMTQAIYDTLSAIAPTVAQSGEYDDFAQPWESATLTIGRALGKEQQAQSMIDDIAARFAEIRTAHPEFAGRTATVAFVNEDGTMGAYTPGDVRARLLTDLGFVVSDEIQELAGDAFYANFSTERMDLVDTDVLLWITGDLRAIDAIKADPIRQTLRAVGEGREIFLDQIEVGAAMSFSSVLSLPYFLEYIEPRLVAAVDGDPATVVGG